jgi:hypothetical protein
MSSLPERPVRPELKGFYPVAGREPPPADALGETSFVEAIQEMHVRAFGQERAGPFRPEPSALRAFPEAHAPRIRQDSLVLVIACAPGALAGVAPESLRHVLRPSAGNGWRSEIVALGAGGRTVSAELLSAPAHLRHHGSPQPAGGEAKRALALRQLGEADRQYCAAIRPEPIRVLQAERGGLCDEAGSPNLPGLVDLFRSTEALAAPGGSHAPRPHLRRFHVFRAIAPGTLLGVSTLLSKGGPQAPSSLSLRSCARRLSDGTVVAFCETVLR